MVSFGSIPIRKLLPWKYLKKTSAPPRHYLAVCAIFKNEERWIAEWIAYHRVVGVDYFILYDNASDDRSVEIIRSLPDQRNIRVVSWPRKEGQLPAYQHAIENFIHVAEWVAFIDVDEFLTPVKDDSLRPVLARYESCSALLVHWAMFGSSGLQEPAPGLCIEMFSRRGPLNFPANRHIKTIARTKRLKSVGLTPHVFSTDGAMMTEDFVEYHGAFLGVLDAEPVSNSIRLHHYFVKSRDDWRKKVERGWATAPGSHRPDDFAIYDLNDECDVAAARFASRVREHLGIASLQSDPPKAGA